MTASLAADAVELQVVEQEHRRVREGLAGLQEAVERARVLSRPAAIDGTVRTLGWLRRDVLPHAAWEEAWLYPQLDAAAGTPWATRVLRFEHEQMRELASALETAFAEAEVRWTPVTAHGLATAMTRLETLLSAHLAQEQWLVEPLLAQETHT